LSAWVSEVTVTRAEMTYRVRFSADGVVRTVEINDDPTPPLDSPAWVVHLAREVWSKGARHKQEVQP
jgi:hypothetical protein